MKKIVASGLALASVFVLSTSAFADTSAETESEFNLISGGLEIEASPHATFGDITLENAPKTYHTSFDSPVNVKDLRGTQEGWRVDVSATQFQIAEPDSGFASGTSAHKLPVGSMLIPPVDSIKSVGDGNGALPSKELTTKKIVDDGVLTLVKANVGEGAGEFDLNFPTEALSLIVDATTAKIDSVNFPDGKTPYTSTLTWDLVSAP